jgi:sulfur carrier protein
MDENTINCSQINIILNGQNFLVDKNANIKQLIDKIKIDAKKIAVEKDYQIIHPQNYETTILQEGSNVEIVHFIGGG